MNIDKKKLQLAMANACMNNRDLALSAKISRISISAYFTGKRKASGKTIGKIARALNVNVTDIIENAAATADNVKR